MTGPAEDVAMRQGCCYGSFDRYCGKPAAIHVWIDGDFCSMSCTEHAGWWDTHPHYDQHPIVTACGLPGTTWMFARDGEPGRCVLDATELIGLVGVEALSVEVPA